MEKRVLIIKTGSTIDSLLARGEDFEHWFMAGADLPVSNYVVCSLHTGDPLPPLDTLVGIIITGSAAYVTDEETWNFRGADYLRAAFDVGVPILGVCYGHQMLAWTFGGEVAFNANGREIGTVEIATTTAATGDDLFNELPPTFTAQVSHLQSVVTLPAGAVQLAHNDFDKNHAFRLGETVWGVQFHPEFNADITRAYIRERAEVIAKEGLDVDALSSAVSETALAGGILRKFVAYCVARQSISAG